MMSLNGKKIIIIAEHDDGDIKTRQFCYVKEVTIDGRQAFIVVPPEEADVFPPVKKEKRGWLKW